MDKAYKFLQTVIFISETTKIMPHKHMASITGPVVLTTEVSLCLEWDMGKENGICFMQTCMKVSIWMIKRTEREFTCGKMGPSMWAAFKMIIGMVMEKWPGMMEGAIKASGLMAYRKMSGLSLIKVLTKTLKIQEQLQERQYLLINKRKQWKQKDLFCQE